MKDYFKISLKNLRRRRLRSWLTMIGIILSITTIFVLVSVSLGLESAVQEQFRSLGTDKFFIQAKGSLAGPGTGGAVQLTDEDVEAIEKISGVKAVTPFVTRPATIEFKNEKRFFNVVGIPLEKEKLSVYTETGFVKPQDGTLLEEGDDSKVMLGYQYKYAKVFSTPVEIGNKITINGRGFKVSSILQTTGSPPDDKIIYMSIDSFRELFPELGESVDQIMIQIDEGEDLEELVAKTEKRLDSKRNVNEKTRDYTILTPEELLASFGMILNLLTGFLLGIAAISLLVGGIGVANTMYTSVIERTKEIGIMKSIGAKNSDILSIFTIEAGLLGAVGGVIGVILGIIIAKLIEYIAITQLGTNLLKAALPPYLIVGCLAFSFAIGAISGLLPSIQASRIKPVDALRYE